MKQNESGAFILSETKNGERIVSCGGRISTRPGTAVELYKKATDKQKNLNLISKVVASGHKTVLEHHNFNIAFNNVSIFVEQYLIAKVDCCIEAINKGVKDVTIMDGRVPHAILMELLTDEGAGTMVMGE